MTYRPDFEPLYNKELFEVDKQYVTESCIAFEHVKGLLIQRTGYIHSKFNNRTPFLWEVWDALIKQGRITRRPQASQQARTDCSAMAVSTLIRDLLCKEAIYFGDNERILTPHPAMIYAIARNEIGGGRLGAIPGTYLEWIIRALKEYGVPYTVDIPYEYSNETLELFDKHPEVYRQFIKKVPFYPIELIGLGDDGYIKKPYAVDAIRHIVIEQAKRLLLAGGMVLCSGTQDVKIVNTGKELLWTLYHRACYHMTYITDYDPVTNRFARFNIWGSEGEYKSPDELNNPSGMAWCTEQVLLQEMQDSGFRLMGFMNAKSKLFESQR